MNLEEEKRKLYKIVDRNDLELRDIIDTFLHSYIEQDVKEECGRACLDIIKKMIIEVAKRCNYDIKENDYLDVDKQLNDFFIAKHFLISESLPNFNLNICRNIEDYNGYIDNNIKSKSILDIDKLSNNISYLNGWLLSFIFKLKKIFVDTVYLLERFISDSNKTYNNPFNDSALPSKNELEKILKIVNSFDEIMLMIKNNSIENTRLTLLKKQFLLERFYSNSEFMEELNKIMKHDTSKHLYYFHGTQALDDAPSILKHGLGMMRDDLSTTAYLEFDIDKLLLYQYGAGLSGREAVIIIDVPFDDNGREINIIDEKEPDKVIPLVPSGNQMSFEPVNYYIKSEHIVGYVDKKNMQVVFNPNYIHYDKESKSL